MTTIDCLGDMCPLPAIKLKKMLERNDIPEILLITDHSCVTASITELCKNMGLLLNIVEPISGVWELRIKRQQRPAI